MTSTSYGAMYSKKSSNHRQDYELLMVLTFLCCHLAAHRSVCTLHGPITNATFGSVRDETDEEDLNNVELNYFIDCIYGQDENDCTDDEVDEDYFP